MSEEEFKIQYLGFIPNFEEATRIRLLASNLYYLAPSDSTVKLTIKKEGVNFNSKIEIHSAYLQIEKISIAEALLDTLVGSQNKVISELNKWKDRRFKDLATEKVICSKQGNKSA